MIKELRADNAKLKEDSEHYHQMLEHMRYSDDKDAVQILNDCPYTACKRKSLQSQLSKLQGALEKMSFNASISERLCSTECVFCKKNMNFATEALTDTAQLREKVGKYEAYFKIKVQRGDMSARFAADYSDEVNAWNKEIDGLQSKLARYEGALEDKVVKCCETCDSFLTHAKCKTFSSNLKAHGRCPFDSQEKKNTDTCDKWNIEALTTAPVGKPADDRCCAMPGTVMCCKNIAPVCETCGNEFGGFMDYEQTEPCPDCQQNKEVEG